MQTNPSHTYTIVFEKLEENGVQQTGFVCLHCVYHTLVSNRKVFCTKVVVFFLMRTFCIEFFKHIGEKCTIKNIRYENFQLPVMEDETGWYRYHFKKLYPIAFQNKIAQNSQGIWIEFSNSDDRFSDFIIGHFDIVCKKTHKKPHSETFLFLSMASIFLILDDQMVHYYLPLLRGIIVNISSQ